MSHPDALKALEAAVSKIEKDHGRGAVMRLGDAPPQRIGTISTGVLSLDIALGIGGVPRGRITEIYGPESSGKTTLCYQLIAHAQRAGGYCVFIDTEHAMDPVYARQVGVDTDNLFVSQPDHGEAALDIAETLIASGGVALLVIDSVAALVPKAELEGEMGDQLPGLHARLMSRAMRKLAGVTQTTNTSVVFTNQIRMKIGQMFGSPETTTGGNALKYYASVRMDIRRIETIKEGGEAVANRVRVKVIKNKVAPPARQAEFEIVYGVGADATADLLELAQRPELALVSKAGAFYTMPGGDKVQGRVKALEWLNTHPAEREAIDARARAVLMPEPEDAAEQPQGAAQEPAGDALVQAA